MDTITLEQRNASRQNLMTRLGYDPTISEATRDEIAAQVASGWDILGEEFTGFRLTFHVRPRLFGRGLMDAETALMKRYGNAPFNYATDFTQYRLTFIVT